MPPNTNEQRILDIIGRIRIDDSSYKKSIGDLNREVKSLIKPENFNNLDKGLQLSLLKAKKNIESTLSSDTKMGQDYNITSLQEQSRIQKTIEATIRKRDAEEKKQHQLKINNLLQQKARLKEQDATRLKVGLSLLFTSQRIGRELTKIQQDLVNTYTQVMGQNNEFVNDINKTTAAFTFLKFSMVNAFAQSEFGQATLKLITELADKSAEFISAKPEVAVKLAIGGASVKTAAGIAEWATQLVLMFGALKSAKELKKVQTALDLLLEGNQGAIDIVSGTTKSFPLKAPISAALSFIGAHPVGIAIAAAFTAAAVVGGIAIGKAIENSRKNSYEGQTAAETIYLVDVALKDTGSSVSDMFNTVDSISESNKELISQANDFNSITSDFTSGADSLRNYLLSLINLELPEESKNYINNENNQGTTSDFEKSIADLTIETKNIKDTFNSFSSSMSELLNKEIKIDLNVNTYTGDVTTSVTD